MPPELREQIPVLQELLKAMQIPVMTLEGYEADDILGTIAKKSEAAGMWNSFPYSFIKLCLWKWKWWFDWRR